MLLTSYLKPFSPKPPSILCMGGANSITRPLADVRNMNAHYVARFGRARHQQEDFRNEQYYKVYIFNAGIDSQLQELNYRFSEKAMELLTLSSTLDP